MIREKFLPVLLWFKDHCHFLLEVVLRLTVGIEKKQLNHDKVRSSIEDDDQKGDATDDKSSN